MTHQTQQYYHPVSELLTNILDKIGYSREDRDRKIRIATEYEFFWNIDMALGQARILCYIYMLGSRGEGSTGPELQSDIDILIQWEYNNVVTDLFDCQPDKINYLMLKDNLTHPGYVKLQLVGILSGYIPVPIHGVGTNEEFLTIDSLNRSVVLNTHYHKAGPISGPALHCPGPDKMHSTDNVFAWRCSKWPREGCEWFQRRRLYGWPTPTQIENALENGCFATPVGHPHSSEEYLEWRLSFSITERELVRSFEDTVMKVYVLLKMIRKTYIQPVVEDAFSSYHCKVCMLWMRESTPLDLWRNENLLYCLTLCIRQLYDWATTGFCPDYFIITNNIYDRKIFGAVRCALVQRLGYLLTTDCRFLLEVECCHLGQLLTYSISGLHIHRTSYLPFVSVELSIDYKLSVQRACAFRHNALKKIPQYYTTMVDYLERIMFAFRGMSSTMQYPLKYAMLVLCSQIGFHIATVCKENARYLSFEKIDYLEHLASGYLSLGMNSDVTSVRLKLCGLGMELGNYDLTEVCLQHINVYRMRYMYSATLYQEHHLSLLNCNLQSCLDKICTKRFSTEELLQTQVSFSVVYMQSEISITPTPLRMEMFRSIGAPTELRSIDDSWFDWGVVDSLMCLHFFQYLNFSRQRKERHKQTAMDNMINVIRTEPEILHRDTAFNLLGYSFMLENQLTNAFACFAESLKIRPYHNAARFYLGLLFRRVLFTHRRHVPF